MAQNKQALKSRIRSIRATKKITSAMELIANAKLAKQRNGMEKNREYAETLQSTVSEIMASNPDLESRFTEKKKSDKVYTIIFSSDLGLCGAYNINMSKLLRENANKSDPLCVIGTKLYGSLKNEGYNIVNEAESVDNLTYEKIQKIADKAIKMYLDDELGRIQVIYTKFVNTVTFDAAINTILPYTGEAKTAKETIFDPSPLEVFDSLIVMMTQNVIYSLSLETKTAEQASRRMAMENANDNAEELEDKLVLAYNQARQAAITQEITEIVSGADAL